MVNKNFFRFWSWLVVPDMASVVYKNRIFAPKIGLRCLGWSAWSVVIGFLH